MTYPPLSILFLSAALATAAPARAANPSVERTHLTVWAWERPEDLRFLPADVDVAVQTGFVELSGNRVLSRGRHAALLARPGQVTTAVVHVQIDRLKALDWSPAVRARAAADVARLGMATGARRVQVDFEVPASRRQVLLDLLGDVRAILPVDTALSMTALASWCGESWLAQLTGKGASVDEVAPMLFRMKAGGAPVRERLAAGGDFAQVACRKALAVSTDTPILRAPTGRHVYLFDPRPWTAADFTTVRKGVEAWSAH
jgi:hypothetical protein